MLYIKHFKVIFKFKECFSKNNFLLYALHYFLPSISGWRWSDENTVIYNHHVLSIISQRIEKLFWNILEQIWLSVPSNDTHVCLLRKLESLKFKTYSKIPYLTLVWNLCVFTNLSFSKQSWSLFFTQYCEILWEYPCRIQYIPRNMHTVFALLCFVVVIHWLIFPYPSGLLHWHCGNLTIAPVPAKQPWWIWINTSCEFIMNDCITTTKQSTTKPCAYFLGYTVC